MTKFSTIRSITIVIAVIAGLYWSSRYNYLLFHCLSEIFSVVIAASIFLVAWNARKYSQSNYFLFIGIAYLAIAALDLIHTLSFPGMQIFEYNFYANQFWVAARYLESLSFLIAFLYIGNNRKFNANLVVMIYIIISGLIISAILVWDIFPEAYIAGEGQTTFKIVSEYIIIGILIIDLLLLKKYKANFDNKIFYLLCCSLALTILSEVSFTLYISNYDIANLIGHYLKFFSFYLIYKAVIEAGFSQPLSVFFHELKQNEEALKNMNVTKDKLFSIIAHDLKSPFNSLIGFSELLMHKYEVFSEEERRKLFVLINNSSKKAHNLLDNLLQWSRTQTGTLKKHPEFFNIMDVIKENKGLLEGAAEVKGIKLVISDNREEMVYADKNMISTVLRNLINNAIKFTPAKGKVTITVDSDEYEVKVSVIDNGVGMTKETIDNLFILEKFKSTLGTANEKGSGLGLIICKEFIEKNNGRISVQSEPKKGSSFIFTVLKKEKLDR